MSPTPSISPLLTPGRVAKLLDVSTAIARRLMREGKIASVNVGAEKKREEWRTTLEYIQAWIGQFPQTSNAALITSSSAEKPRELRIIREAYRSPYARR